MSGSRRIGRRGFFASALGVAATALTAKLAFKRESTLNLSTDAERLVSALSSTESAAELGRAYMETVPFDRSVDVLVERIVAVVPGGYTSVREGDERELKTLLEHEFKEDFRGGNVVIVDGWILSRTEARLYALAAILESGS